MLPIRPKQHIIDDRAVDIFRTRVHKLGWVFRELNDDYGIDAEVEIRDSKEMMTGALLRFQIKGHSTERVDALGKVKVKISSLRYWFVSPIPIFMAYVNILTKKILILQMSESSWDADDFNHIVMTKNKTFTISFSDALSFNDWTDALREIALDHQNAVLDITKYTLYNPVFQFISCHRLFRQHGGDIEKMLKWYREEVPDDQLVYEYGHAVYLKKQIENNPKFLKQLKAMVYEDD